MTQILPILVPAAKLSKSPSNVRKTTDALADAQLEANIAERGVIQNLIGVPAARKKGQYRITAGGRRLDAVHRLIEKGVFAGDYQVPVLILADAGDAIEISFAENFFKLAMNPAEACRAFQDIIETEGKSPADIAKRFGLTERFVLGRLRLACLAEPVFEALRDGEITLDVASAYASTGDVERQATIFGQLGQSYYRDNVGEIRRQLASFSYRASDPKAILVGRDAYLAEGGRIESDLFSDAESEAWLDTHIVDRLAQDALIRAAVDVRDRDGFADVRIVTATHVPYMETYDLEPLRGEPVPLTDAEEARQSELQSEIAEIEAQAGDDELSEDEENRLTMLEAELSAIADKTPIVTDEQKAQAIAYVVIGPDGQPRVHEQLYVAPVEADELDTTEDDDGEAETADEAAPTKPGISQRLADELAMMKTELLAVHVAGDPQFALDLGTFIMAEVATRAYGVWAIPSDLRANAPAPRVSGFDSGTAAAAQMAALHEGLDRSWTNPGTIEERYDAFCALPAEARAAWLGWLVARTLHAVPAGVAGLSFVDLLGQKLEIDVASWWRPTARTYFDRITKPSILALFEDIGGAELRQRYGASKKHDLAASAEKLFAGEITIEADVKARALAWLPAEMRFDHDVPEPVPTGSSPAVDADVVPDDASLANPPLADAA
ncbi:MAG: ParB/RepB/Spo0J family partition protein [Sphingopyxis sp.]|nr:ParB/RepB/Spo0J family partition protein [Sphingopyxis sp.]